MAVIDGGGVAAEVMAAGDTPDGRAGSGIIGMDKEKKRIRLTNRDSKAGGTCLVSAGHRSPLGVFGDSKGG